jgi:hypothetical protein
MVGAPSISLRENVGKPIAADRHQRIGEDRHRRRSLPSLSRQSLHQAGGYLPYRSHRRHVVARLARCLSRRASPGAARCRFSSLVANPMGPIAAGPPGPGDLEQGETDAEAAARTRRRRRDLEFAEGRTTYGGLVAPCIGAAPRSPLRPRADDGMPRLARRIAGRAPTLVVRWQPCTRLFRLPESPSF